VFAVADNGGNSLVLQVVADGDTHSPADMGGDQLALAQGSGDELSVVESKQQVNLLWHGITWHQRLRALLARGEVAEALDALLEWHGARSAMTQSPAAVYNALLKLVNDTHLPSAVAVSAYELMRSRGVKPNAGAQCAAFWFDAVAPPSAREISCLIPALVCAATYDHLLRALIRDGKPEIAARVLVSMEQTGHRPDASAYNGIMQSLAERGGRGDMTMALQIGAKAVEVEMDITVSTFNKLLVSCAREGGTDEGVSTFKLLQRAGQTADEESYSALLECTCMGSDVSLSMKALKGMTSAGYTPRINSVNRMLASCTASEQASAVFKLVADFPDVQLNSRSYAELMRCVRAEGNLEFGVRSLKLALRAGIYLDGDVVGSIIDMAVEAVDKSEEEKQQTDIRLREETAARMAAESAQRESERVKLEALALAQANKDEALSWREQAAAAEDAAAEASGSFDKFDQEWLWMETVIQDEREQRAAAVSGQEAAEFMQAKASASAERDTAARIRAEDAAEAAERARLLAESEAARAIAEASAWREVALAAENAMEDMAHATGDAEELDQEWQWMEAAIQDEVASRSVAEEARAYAELTQTRAEERAKLDTVARALAEEESEKSARARLAAVAEAAAAKGETAAWRETAMAAEASAAELAEDPG
jgi:pentatricopeptide repeat protein